MRPALGGHIDDGAFEQFEHALLHSFSADVARDGGIVAFAGDLVDFVDEDDAALCASHIVVGHLQQTAEDAFHVFADVTGLREHRGVDNGEGHFEEFGDGARQEGLPVPVEPTMTMLLFSISTLSSSPLALWLSRRL